MCLNRVSKNVMIDDTTFSLIYINTHKIRPDLITITSSNCFKETLKHESIFSASIAGYVVIGMRGFAVSSAPSPPDLSNQQPVIYYVRQGSRQVVLNTAGHESVNNVWPM